MRQVLLAKDVSSRASKVHRYCRTKYDHVQYSTIHEVMSATPALVIPACQPSRVPQMLCILLCTTIHVK